MKKRKRVLFYTEGWGNGGIESFIVNAISALGNEEFEFEIFCTHDSPSVFDEKIEKLGVPRTAVFKGCKPGLVKRFQASSFMWDEILSQADYDVVHINTMNGMGFAYAEIAARHGVPNRIVHSHNSHFGKGMRLVKEVGHCVGKHLWSSYATKYLACSSDSGRYLFGKRPFTIVENALDTNRFCFNPDVRCLVRQEFSIASDVTLIGNIGRMAEAKNPVLQLEIFNEFLKLRPGSKYLMVGDGDLRPQVEEAVERLGIEESVILRSSISNPEDFYSALDVFLMPSSFEGLAMTGVEAQCAGLPILLSDSVSDEMTLTDLASRCSLSDSPNAWSQALIDCLARYPVDRSRYAKIIGERGYSLSCLAGTLRKAYRSS